MTHVPITTHVLNLQSGRPVQGMNVRLHFDANSDVFTQATTDNDGRIVCWDNAIELMCGVWTLTFETEKWFSERKEKSFFPSVKLSFNVDDLNQHYHVPLLLNAFGYSTYRGS